MSAKAQEVALDRVLVDRFKGGDQSAFDEMVSRYWDRIYAMVHQLLRNQQDAEEVTQDAFIRAHRGLANFRGDSAFSTWLYQIATNLARNRYWYWWRRKRDRSVSFEAPIGTENETTLAELIPAGPGKFKLSPDYIPPTTAVGASHNLARWTRALRDLLVSRGQDFASVKRQRGIRAIAALVAWHVNQQLDAFSFLEFANVGQMSAHLAHACFQLQLREGSRGNVPMKDIQWLVYAFGHSD